MQQPKTIKDFLDQIRGKSIHIVGVTGAEGSSILRLLRKYNIENIVAHDFLDSGTIEKSFKLWHKGLDKKQKSINYSQFKNDLRKSTFYTSDKYLKNINSADLIFVPQSWRLYTSKNKHLFKAYKKGIPFMSITKLYLGFAPGCLVAVTGTVGKGSVANMLCHFLKAAGKKVYFAGNETWMMQLADKLDQMDKEDILVLEVSHRQLEDGFVKAPKIVVFTNLYPNHLDEVSWQKYKSLKLSLVRRQTSEDIAILNYDNSNLRKLSTQAKSKIYYYSEKDINMNIKSIQEIFDIILSKKSRQYLINLLAASTAANIMGISSAVIRDNITNIKSLPARLELLGKIRQIWVYNDIKSTTPWATIKGIEELKSGVVLICGGRVKGIDYKKFAAQIKKKTRFIVVLKSELSNILVKLLPKNTFYIKDNLTDALRVALNKAIRNDKILVSPAASFFYSDFIKRRASLKKVFREVKEKLK